MRFISWLIFNIRALEMNNRPILGGIFVRIQGGVTGYVMVTTAQKRGNKANSFG